MCSPNRCEISAGSIIFTRLAASSMARGRPSSRRVTSITAGAFASVRRNPGILAAARSVNSRIDSTFIEVVDPPLHLGHGHRRHRQLLFAGDAEGGP